MRASTTKVLTMSFDSSLLGEHLFQLAVAALAGCALGLDRELSHRWAGLRTHMVVSAGAALFVLLAVQNAAGDRDAVARVISGIATGIGFLGAGTILKQSDREQIKGLTTASSIWFAAGLGSVAGVGQYELLLAGTIIALIALVALKPVSNALGEAGKQDDAPKA